MWRLFPVLRKNGLVNKRHFSTSWARLFLSESFKLDNVWNDRLKSPILSKINVTDLFYELDSQYQRTATASALDIDLFVNAVNDEYSFDEVEFLVHKLRLSPEAVNILPSTHHALIRLYMGWNKTDDLMRILDDRLNYGIFPDDYCSLLMIDSFIKQSNFRDAAKISTLGMLQEDVSNHLLNYFSLFSFQKYLENPVPWNQEVNEEIEDDDEEVKVRVKYIRNPYFDDHFDLVDPMHLIGKSMTLIGHSIDDHVGKTYTLLGLILHDKVKQAMDYIETLKMSGGNNIIIKDGFELANKILEDSLNNQNKDDILKSSLKEVRDLLNKAFTGPQLVEDDLFKTIENRLNELVKEREPFEINRQFKLYQEWEEKRIKLLSEQIARLNREKQLAEVQRQKELLKQKEEELFFFDNEDKIDLILEEKDKYKEQQRERERKIMESKRNMIVKKEKVKPRKAIPEQPPLESFFDENIPMKLVKTKL